MEDRKELWLACILVIVSVLYWHQSQPVKQPNGVLVKEAPQQVNYEIPKLIKNDDGHKIEAIAQFDIKARVLAKERYRMDEGAWLMPWDFALGWQKMSDNTLLEKLNISQGSRFYFYSWKDEMPEAREIVSMSANMHLAPSDDAVGRVLARAKVGDVIILSGKLIRATNDKGRIWTSSLSRNDTGAGACEIIWVEAAVIEPRP